MTVLEWDKVSEKVFETGVDKGVLYLPNAQGEYIEGYAWNGLVSVSESPSGAESNKQYANNRVYLNLMSAEEFAATIEAFTYPDKFAECDGSAELAPGVFVAQQRRKTFGLSYRSLVGNDVDGTDFGYKLHLVYEGLAAPSEKTHTTLNDSPEAETFSWEVSTTPVTVPGHKPAATITIDSTKVSSAKLAELEQILYGSAGVNARLPLPVEIIAMFAGTSVQVSPVAPAFDGENQVTIPVVTGVVYKIDGEIVTGVVTVPVGGFVVTASPALGYKFPSVTDNDWLYEPADI